MTIQDNVQHPHINPGERKRQDPRLVVEFEPSSSVRVYLSGPITGLTWSEATDWRDEAKRMLAKRGVVAISPMREKEGLHETLDDHDPIPALSATEFSAERDIEDVLNCDALLVNLLPGTNSDIRTVSQGTILEVGLARACYLPVVVVARQWDRHLQCALFRACITSLHEVKTDGIMVPEGILDEVAVLAEEMC